MITTLIRSARNNPVIGKTENTKSISLYHGAVGMYLMMLKDSSLPFKKDQLA